jgi:hypothetical protein
LLASQAPQLVNDDAPYIASSAPVEETADAHIESTTQRQKAPLPEAITEKDETSSIRQKTRGSEHAHESVANTSKGKKKAISTEQKSTTHDQVQSASGAEKKKRGRPKKHTGSTTQTANVTSQTQGLEAECAPRTRSKIGSSTSTSTTRLRTYVEQDASCSDLSDPPDTYVDDGGSAESDDSAVKAEARLGKIRNKMAQKSKKAKSSGSSLESCELHGISSFKFDLNLTVC